jgi:hypothetical protein
MALTQREQLEQRHTALLKKRGEYEPGWKALTQVLIPHRTVWDRQNTGERKNRHVYNNKPLLAVRSLAAWLMAGMSSPAREWFNFTLEDEDLAKWKPVRMWLEQCREIVQSSLAKSSWYRSLASAVYLDMAVVGNGAMLQEIVGGQTRFMPLPIGEYCLDVNHMGQVDTCIRDLEMPVRLMVQKFGKAACSRTVRDAFDNGNLEMPVRVKHAIKPRTEYSDRGGSQAMPWASCWWEVSDDRLNGFLSESGYEEFPGLFPRWQTTTHLDAYGRGPGSDVEGDVLMLQHHEKAKLGILDQYFKPTLLLRGVKRASLVPGQAIHLGNNEHADVRALLQNPPGTLGEIKELIFEVEKRIGEGLYDHLWGLLYGDERNQRPTATEVEASRNETALQMGPLLLSVNEELLAPAVEREFSIRDRHGDIPEPPEEVQGMGMRVEFQSVLQTLQQSHGLIATRALVQEMRMIAEVRPDVLDKMDVDAIADEIQRVTGARADSLLDKAEVQKLRAARAEQEQAQRQGEAMVQASGAIKNLGQTDPTNLAELARAAGPIAAGQAGLLGQARGAA